MSLHENQIKKIFRANCGFMFFEFEIDESPISVLAVKIYTWFGCTLILGDIS